jgi:small-conductance mechanosensitive channel
VVHSSLRVAMARTGRALLIFTGLLVSLTLVGIDLTVLSVFGGALGVGLGLGLQKIASNYVSGFVILLDRSLKIGDMIAVDKYYGKVTQINSRYTVLQGMDGIESVLPNEMLVSGAVQNFSLTNSSIRLGARMVLPVDADLLQLFPLFEAAVVKIERVLPDPAPDTALIKVSGDGLEVEVGFWINDPQNGRGGITSRVYQAMLAIVREHGLVLPGTTTPVVVHAATLAAVSANAAPTSETRSGGLSQ